MSAPHWEDRVESAIKSRTFYFGYALGAGVSAGVYSGRWPEGCVMAVAAAVGFEIVRGVRWLVRGGARWIVSRFPYRIVRRDA